MIMHGQRNSLRRGTDTRSPARSLVHTHTLVAGIRLMTWPDSSRLIIERIF